MKARQGINGWSDGLDDETSGVSPTVTVTRMVLDRNTGWSVEGTMKVCDAELQAGDGATEGTLRIRWIKMAPRTHQRQTTTAGRMG
jgi:hypothetical protein